MGIITASNVREGHLVDIAPFIQDKNNADIAAGEYALITGVVPLDAFVVRLENDIEPVVVRIDAEMGIPDDF